MPHRKLAGPVGIRRRTTPGAKVRNSSQDVMLVQSMLEANGYKMDAPGKVSPSLSKAIGDFQKNKTSLKTPDCVVDPGGPTFKALLPKYLADQRKLEKMGLVAFRLNGKDYVVTTKQRRAIEDDLLKTCATLAGLWRGDHKLYAEIYQDFLDTALLKDGILNAITQAVVTQVRRNPIDLPPYSIVSASSDAISKLERIIKSRKLASLEKAMIAAETKLRAFKKAMNSFVKKSGVSAGKWSAGASFTASVSFGIVGALAAPLVVPAVGSVAAASAVTAAGTSFLQSSANEFGKYAVDGKVGPGSVKNVAVDTAVGAIASLAGGKLSKGANDYVAKKLASNTPGLADDLAKVFWKKWLANASGDISESVGKDVINLGSDALLKGKSLGKKDVIDVVYNAAFSVASRGPRKDLESFNKKWLYNADKLKPEIISTAVKKLVNADEAGRVLRVSSVAKQLSKAAEVAIKEAVHVGIHAYDGKGNLSKMNQAAEQAALNNETFTRAVQAAVNHAVTDGAR